MLLSAFLLGLFGSLHCVGMCGPIAFMLPVDHKNKVKKAIQTSSYHFGRLLAYALIGLVFGLLGKSFSLFGLQQQLSIAVGVLMILVVVLPLKPFQNTWVSQLFYRFVSKLKQKMGASFKKKTTDTFLTIGFLNGFLPCGLVYIAVFASIAAGSLTQSSLYMLFFGLGTIPLMTVSVYASSFLKGINRQKVRKAIPVFVVIIGILFILRGMGLGIPYISPKPINPQVDSKIECHI
ncbi:sulfite exporter TauE/SafE family protein [uncultured Planktosalinus sp.]|uniref:sulfite exporter TauE/SafE family protein n=1 Tax=uncultured Planktosalinus sp. TaxID=1810935 RepID=UPI0030D82833